MSEVTNAHHYRRWTAARSVGACAALFAAVILAVVEPAVGAGARAIPQVGSTPGTGPSLVSHELGTPIDGQPGKTAFGRAAVSLSPWVLSFGNEPVGETSGPKTVTVTNYSNVDLDFGTSSYHEFGGSVQFGPAPSPPPEPCAGDLAPGGSCQLSFVFTPLRVGGQSAQVGFVVRSREGDNPRVAFSISLFGRGVTSGPPAATPEAPSVLLLPVAAVGVVALGAAMRRRSRRTAA